MAWKSFKHAKGKRWVLFAPQISTFHLSYDDALRFKNQLIAEGVKPEEISIKKEVS